MTTRGRLRIYLGYAPGAGTICAPLGDGRRRAAEGADVVVACAQTRGRAGTVALLGGLEVVAPAGGRCRGAEVHAVDLDAVLAWAPRVALVDELAYRNGPGARHAGRWQEVEVLLAAGIDVISTVRIGQLESLADVAGKVTGAAPWQTVPDRVVRAAAEVELVDVAPEVLLERMASRAAAQGQPQRAADRPQRRHRPARHLPPAAGRRRLARGRTAQPEKENSDAADHLLACPRAADTPGPGRRRRRGWLASSAVAAAALIAAGCASSSPGPGPALSSPAAGSPAAAVQTTTIHGARVLTSARGFTLYSFAPDTATTSRCNRSCARLWPPVHGPVTAGPGVTGTLGVIKRSDGTTQATYNGHPLYTYVADTAPGQANGNGINASGGIWHEVTASAAAPAPSSSGAGGYGY
jgi:predicted lipoprotein with Yx(FWY)xxD motif